MDQDEYNKGDRGTYSALDDLSRDTVQQKTSFGDRSMLEYVVRTLHDADGLGRDLVWQSEVWDGCTVEELLGALLEAEEMVLEEQEEMQRESEGYREDAEFGVFRLAREDTDPVRCTDHGEKFDTRVGAFHALRQTAQDAGRPYSDYTVWEVGEEPFEFVE